MKKSIFITNLMTLIILCFMAVKNGIDILLLIAIAISVVANGLNIACVIKEAKEKK